AFYSEQSAQYGRYNDVQGYTCIQRIFIAAIYEAWRARCGNMPDIEFGHFLANPIRITEQGPRTLGKIATAHQAIRNMAERSGLGDEKYEMLASYPAIVRRKDLQRTMMDLSIYERLRSISRFS
ncbi:hypothetical protein BKA66DRAFT_583242, partial [Pyrenochaeta sp. MPI-SDFR-AT-0127]